MTSLTLWLHKVAKGRVTLLALVIFVLFSAIVLPAQADRTRQYSGNAGTIDTRFWYSTEEIYHKAESYGKEGRRAYIIERVSFDLIWPLVYAFCLGTTISFFFQRSFPSGSWMQGMNLVPVIAMLFDLMENIAASVLMLLYPNELPWLAKILPYFTSLKWLLIFGSFILVIVGVGAWVMKKLRKSEK